MAKADSGTSRRERNKTVRWVVTIFITTIFVSGAISLISDAVMENSSGTRVIVGPENVSEELKDTSVVMTKFDIGEGMQGMIGVVGPTRMDYAKVTARLSYFAESLSKMFAKPEQPQLPGSKEPEEQKE